MNIVINILAGIGSLTLLCGVIVICMLALNNLCNKDWGDDD